MERNMQRSLKAPHLARAEEFLGRLLFWAGERDDVRALVVVGSFARGNARPDSDLDVILLVRDASRYLQDATWVSTFGEVQAIGIEAYGRVTSIRVLYHDGLDLELGIAPADWASGPFDPGTEEVARGGIVIYLDRDGHATTLATALGSPNPALKRVRLRSPLSANR
jgi:predicted nucleotidyltransferase